MAGRVADKVCVVTGGASGIGPGDGPRAGRRGRACCRRRHRRGSRRTGGRRARAAARPPSPSTSPTRPRSSGLYADVVERFGRLDVCHNNAGILLPGDTDPVATTLDTWNRLIAVNLTGVFLCMRHQIPHLLASGGGSIVNMASFVAVMGAATPQIAYSASKGGVLSMSREVAAVYARQGIRCNASARARSTPGWSAHFSPTRPSGSGARCTSRTAGSASRRRSHRPWSTWRRTNPAGRTGRRSWSTAASARRTRRRFRGGWWAILPADDPRRTRHHRRSAGGAWPDREPLRHLGDPRLSAGPGILLGPNEPTEIVLIKESDVTTFVSELGIIFLLFFLGLEFSVGRLMRSGRYSLVGGTIDLVINWAMGLIVGVAVFGPAWPRSGRREHPCVVERDRGQGPDRHASVGGRRDRPGARDPRVRGRRHRVHPRRRRLWRRQSSARPPAWR